MLRRNLGLTSFVCVALLAGLALSAVALGGPFLWLKAEGPGAYRQVSVHVLAPPDPPGGHPIVPPAAFWATPYRWQSAPLAGVVGRSQHLIPLHPGWPQFEAGPGGMHRYALAVPNPPGAVVVRGMTPHGRTHPDLFMEVLGTNGVAALFADVGRHDPPPNCPSLYAVLTGNAEVPPNPSPAMGVMSLNIHVAESRLALAVVVHGITPEQLIGSAIHLGPEGQVGPEIFDLGPGLQWADLDGLAIARELETPFPPEYVTALLEGQTYVNLRTASYPDGEIRGQITAPPECATGASVRITNGVVGDGELEVNPDAYGAITVWNWPDNYDWYDPIGTNPRSNCAFAASMFIYNPITLDRLALGEHGRDLDVTYNQRNGGEATLSYEITWPLCAFDTDGNGFDDTAISAFRVFGGNGNYDLAFGLLQRVSQPVEGGISTLEQVYTVTNVGSQPASFLLERHNDLDLLFDGLWEDCAGTASVQGRRNVYMREADGVPNHDNLVVALSGTPGFVYCAGRSGFDPDGAGGDPPMSYGTDFQVWENFGLPQSWVNYTAGIGYDQDGILPQKRPPGSTTPYDGFMMLQWELTLAPGEARDIEIVTTYGNEVPVFCLADLDGDRDVDLADLAILLAHYGMTEGAPYEWGDLDGDADVDLADLAALLAVYGTNCP